MTTYLIFYDNGYDHQLGKRHHHQDVLWFSFFLMFWSTIKTIDFHHHHDHQGHDHLSKIIWSTALSSGCNHLGIASASSFCHHEHLKHVNFHHYRWHAHLSMINWSSNPQLSLVAIIWGLLLPLLLVFFAAICSIIIRCAPWLWIDTFGIIYPLHQVSACYAPWYVEIF